MNQRINDFMALVAEKNPNEPEFIQAVREFAETVIPFIADHKKYDGKNLLLRNIHHTCTCMIIFLWNLYIKHVRDVECVLFR